MKYHTTITQKWQMTIPKHVRKVLGLTHPGRISVAVEPKRKAFMIEQLPSIFDFAEKFHPKRNRNVNVMKAREYFEQHYGRT